MELPGKEGRRGGREGRRDGKRKYLQKRAQSCGKKQVLFVGHTIVRISAEFPCLPHV